MPSACPMLRSPRNLGCISAQSWLHLGAISGLISQVKMIRGCEVPMALMYVGKRQPDKVPRELDAQANELTAAGDLLELERADFGDISAIITYDLGDYHL